jgi:hypothetical protein
MLKLSRMIMLQAAAACMQWGGSLAAFADGQQSSTAAVLLPTGGSAWIGLIADPNASATLFTGQPGEWPQYWDFPAASTANLSSKQKVNFVPSAGLTGRLFPAVLMEYFDRLSGTTSWVKKATDCSCGGPVGMPCWNCEVAGCTLLHSDGSWSGAACNGALLINTSLPAMCRRMAPPSNECVLRRDTCDAAAECVDTPGSYFCNCT